MKRLLMLLLLIGIAGCGPDTETENTNTPTAKTDAPYENTPTGLLKKIYALAQAEDYEKLQECIFPHSVQDLPDMMLQGIKDQKTGGDAAYSHKALKLLIDNHLDKLAPASGKALEYCERENQGGFGQDKRVREIAKTQPQDITMFTYGRVNILIIKFEGDHKLLFWESLTNLSGESRRDKYPEPTDNARGNIKLPAPEDYEDQSMPWVTAGVINPKTDPADTDKVQPNEKVIGIIFKDQPRAYLLAALDHVERTVVNDVIHGTPISITYYPMESRENEPQKRVRVFVDVHGSEALVMGLAGTEKGKMMIYCGEKQYLQMGSKIPVWHDANEDGKKQKDEIHVLEDLEFEVLTWSEWRKQHPETDIFRGIGMRGETPPNL